VKHGSLFSGYAGLDLAVNAVFGSETAWVSDVDPGACKILAHRLPDVPNLGDITTVDWSQVEPVEVMSGGFPCQDLSHAGKRAGMKPGTRSGLWSHMAYAISQLRPRYVVAENVRGLLSGEAHSDVELCPWCMGDGTGEPPLRALGAVLGDLADIGYDARWVGLRAADVGAPHGRFRVFVVARDAARDDGRDDAESAGDRRGRPLQQTGSASGAAADARHERARRTAGPGEAGSGRARDHLAGRGFSTAADNRAHRTGRRAARTSAARRAT
jgi:DNA (cytosine-5)-methyltransferase 1